jgi:hypothetical protein
MSGGGTQSKDELQEMFFKLNKITKEFNMSRARVFTTSHIFVLASIFIPNWI